MVSKLMMLGDQRWEECKVEERILETKDHELKRKLKENQERREMCKLNGEPIPQKLIKDNLKERMT